MAATPLRNYWDWPDMGELDAYVDAYNAWEKQVSRLSELITLMNDFAKVLEGRPPFRVPADWPSQEQLTNMTAAAMAAWTDMVARYQAIPNDKKAHARPLPTHAGYRQPIGG